MSESEQAAADSTNPVAESSKPAAKSTRPVAAGRGLALVAIVLALIAIAGIAYMDWTVRPLYGLTAQLEGDTERLSELRLSLERRIDRLEAETERNAVAAGDLQSALTADVAIAAELSQQLNTLSQRLDDISGIDSGQRNRLLQDEAIYFLRVANAQAMLAGNPDLAASALRIADDRLRATGDPALTAVRRQLGEELAALEALPSVDIAGISFRLQSLAAQARDWPLANPAPDRFGGSGAEGESAAEAETAWQRLQQTVVDVFTSIVSIRQSDAPPDVQLSEAEQSLVIESVRAELQLARLTLVTGELPLYQQSVERAAAQIRDYFDTDAAAVAAALDALAEFAAAELPGELPDISGSLSLLLGKAEPAAAAESP